MKQNFEEINLLSFLVVYLVWGMWWGYKHEKESIGVYNQETAKSWPCHMK